MVTLHRSPVTKVTLSEKYLVSVCSEYNHVRYVASRTCTFHPPHSGMCTLHPPQWHVYVT